MRVKVKCDWCGKGYERLECQLKGKRHHFCSRECLAAFSNKSKNPEGYAKLKDYTNISAHMSELNVEMNPDRMTPEVRAKLRACHMAEGNGRTYAKIYGKKEHRVIAEKVIGRPLLPNEVVHHIDCNRRNNDPNNLMVLTASEHASMKSIREDSIMAAFTTVMNKLIFARDKVLLPFSNTLKTAEKAEYLDEFTALEDGLEKNLQKRQQITQLFTKGYLDPAVYAQQNDELLNASIKL